MIYGKVEVKKLLKKCLIFDVTRQQIYLKITLIWQFNLPAYAAQRLREAGVTRIADVRQDTYTQPERFHSYRRAGHRGEETAGRQLSIIALGR